VRQATCSGGQVPADVTASLAMGETLSVLFARLRGRFGGVLYRHHIPADDGEDLVQTTLLLAVTKWTGIRDPEAWLIGTLHKRCILYWRTRWSHTEHTRPFEELDREPSVEPDQTHRERFADLGRVWHRLPPAQRRLLLLRFREGMSPREAAQAVGLAYSSVRKTTNRACERLREALGTAPPRGTPGGQRAPRQPAAATGQAERLRAEGGVAAAWMAAVDTFMAVKAPHLRAQHLRDLAGAGIALGPPSLAELRIEDLACFRLTLADKAPSLRSQILYSLRSFLLWAGERSDHALQPDAVCQALRVGKAFRREAAGTRASAEWRAAVEAFLAVSTVSAHTQRQYRHHLFKAGAVMGWPALAAVTESDLLAFRAALLADGRSAWTQYGELVVVRCFLLWVREHGGMAVHPEVLRAVLQSWNPRRQRPPLPDGSGRAAPTSSLAQPAGHAAAREAPSGEDPAQGRGPRGGRA
jgi:RNA polymerase sigma factor (sigma-70 family)